jgi:hypothetical protein
MPNQLGLKDLDLSATPTIKHDEFETCWSQPIIRPKLNINISVKHKMLHNLIWEYFKVLSPYRTLKNFLEK